MIINLTQHIATPDQIEAGVIDLDPQARKELGKLLTFDTLPVVAEVLERARLIASMVPEGSFVMIGGAPYLMGPLCAALRARGAVPLFAFSKRVSKETQMPDGSVKKENIFVHEGFIPG